MSIINPSGRPPILGDVSRFDARLDEGRWPWAERNADAIASHWQEATAERSGLFDGEVLVAKRVEVKGEVLEAGCIAVRYSALAYWQKRGYPPADAFNLFGAGIVVARDGAVLLGRMAAHTANAGYTYFPCGTPDLEDVVQGRLDLDSSILRELEEETGLGVGHVRPSEQRWIAWDGGLFCCARRLDTDLTAVELSDIVAANLAAEERPELERIVLVRSPDELDSSVPAYARALVTQILA